MPTKKPIILNQEEDNKNLDHNESEQPRKQNTNEEDEMNVPDKLIGDDLFIEQAKEDELPEDDENSRSTAY